MSRPDTELLELCASNKLSLDALQETINIIGPRVSSQNPSCFHDACGNKNVVTLGIVQLLHNTLPEALRLRDDFGDLPIHHLCLNKDLDETVAVDILRFMLEVDPNLVRGVGYAGHLPIYDAVQANKSSAFCNIIIDAYPESLRIAAGDGRLPIHVACEYDERDDTVDTIQYMLELEPELINNAGNSSGWLPIHFAGRTKSIELLLKFDPDAASKEVNGIRWLPLHLACMHDTNLSSIQDLSSVRVLYDAYPDAILASDRDGRTPVDIAQRHGNQPAIEFLQTQLVYARQAQDMTAMAALDEIGQLPLHRALKGNASLGSIKLLTRTNPAAVQVSDHNGAYPLHIACEFSSVKVVKYLVELAEVDTLNNSDAKNNSLLHYACRGGKCDVVKYLLESNVPSVLERNNDNKLAIHLLFECGENLLDRVSIAYVETVRQLLLANPEVARDFMSY